MIEKISDIAIKETIKKINISEDKALDLMKERFKIMKESSKKYLDKDGNGKLISGICKKFNENDNLSGENISKAVKYAFSIMETNISMGKIVAAPTAGSSGVLAGGLISIMENEGINEEKIIKVLFTAGYIGEYIAENATLAGAEGGCQAEIGSASAMLAASLVELRGGSIDEAYNASAIALKNMLGLVCDPVAGLVESPCIKRNAIGISNAFISAQIALSGIKSIIPFNEVVTAMDKIGKKMPCSLKETSKGGLAKTKTAKNFDQSLILNKF